ncbi:hypothetical protein BDZ94DRAFT_1266590 [Collybia nuda]|uniref:F-box domain-containing protein n=1 Tax=Collybia nuda TaxID=64659 RepID=A0A9P5Y2G1_9AGAR|nr:hypothetical protein BDZ94DRAFT_1266590 [Collybia nuda]
MLTSTITKNSDTFLILESIKQCASSLSESHLRQQYIHPDHGPTLQSLIASALCNLSQCIDTINARSSVSRLTQDALSVIFHEVHQADLEKSDPQGTWSRSSIPATLCLSQVSKAWKNVATNLPTLWTTVKVTTPWSFASIKTCLSMSRSLPIDLYIKGLKKKDSVCFLEPARYHVEDDIEGLCAILLPHIPRCRSISITTDKLFWPLLQEFEIQFSDTEAPLGRAIHCRSIAILPPSLRVNHDFISERK